MSLFSSSVPTYLYATPPVGPSTTSRRSTPMSGTVYTKPPSRSMPIAAPGGPGRATYLMERVMETAARELGVTPAELRRNNFIREFPHQTPVIMCYETRATTKPPAVSGDEGVGL